MLANQPTTPHQLDLHPSPSRPVRSQLRHNTSPHLRRLICTGK
jgi:hypothetical protein